MVAGIQSRLATNLQKRQLQEVTGASTPRLTTSFIDLLFYLASFVQLWLLTRMFPVLWIAVLIGASLLGRAINAVIGAVVGFTVPEKREKIFALSIIWSVQRRVFNCFVMGTSMLVMLMSSIGSLWEFWTRPIGDPHAKFWIVVFQFLIPQLVEIPYSIAMTWPTVISGYMDDDLRNSSLAASFSGIIYKTLYLLFPIWVVRDQIQSVLGRSIPHIYVLLSAPLLAFMLGSLLPFVIGVHRFRSQSRQMLQWEERWLQELYESTQRPLGPARDAAINEKVDQLEKEIHRSFSQNRVMEVYQSLAQGDVAESDRPTLPGTQQPAIEVKSSQIMLAEPSNIPSKFDDIRRVLLGSGDMLRSANPPENPLEVLEQQMWSVLQKHRSDLIDWDVRFNYLWNLVRLYEIGRDAGTQDASAFVRARMEGIRRRFEGLTPKSNVLMGLLTAALSTIFVALFQTYHVEIFSFVGRLVRF